MIMIIQPVSSLTFESFTGDHDEEEVGFKLNQIMEEFHSSNSSRQEKKKCRTISKYIINIYIYRCIYR